jgi:hypothetical protein
MLPMFFDGFLIVLLLAGALGGWRLHKKIVQLQDMHQEFQKALQAFDHTSRQTSETLIVLESKAKEAQTTIETAVASVGPIRQDLVFLCQRAETLADALMQAPTKKDVSRPSTVPLSTPQDGKSLSRVERELADMMAQRQA